MSLFVHVDQLNKRETFDAHCINVCHQEEQEKSSKTKRSSSGNGKNHSLLIVNCDLFVIFALFGCGVSKSRFYLCPSISTKKFQYNKVLYLNVHKAGSCAPLCDGDNSFIIMFFFGLSKFVAKINVLQ